MPILINNCYSKIDNENIPEHTFIISYPYFYKRRARFADVESGKARKRGDLITVREIKNISLLFDDVYFPTGYLKKLDYKNLKLIDSRVKPINKLSFINKEVPTLRPEYQPEAFDRALKYGRGVINHAPNSGKTILAIALMQQLKLTTLYIVPTKTLLYQAYKDITEFIDEEFVGIIGDGQYNLKPITVATVQTLWNIYKKDAEDLVFKKDCMFIDECHKININSKTWNSYFKIALNVDAYYRFGLTATPHAKGSLERTLLESVTAGILHTVTQSDLMKWGYSTKTNIVMYEWECDGSFNNWQESYQNNIYENLKFNTEVANLARKYREENKSVLIIVNRVVTQLELLKTLLPEAIFLSGKSSSKDRISKMDYFENNNSILISTILNEGVNLPSIDVLIIACGNKNQNLVIQRVGRIVRKKENKKEVLVIDFMFNRDKYLHDHSLNRKKYYLKEEEFNFEIKQLED